MREANANSCAASRASKLPLRAEGRTPRTRRWRKWISSGMRPRPRKVGRQDYYSAAAMPRRAGPARRMSRWRFSGATRMRIWVTPVAKIGAADHLAILVDPVLTARPLPAGSTRSSVSRARLSLFSISPSSASSRRPLTAETRQGCRRDCAHSVSDASPRGGIETIRLVPDFEQALRLRLGIDAKLGEDGIDVGALIGRSPRRRCRGHAGSGRLRALLRAWRGRRRSAWSADRR